MAGNFLDIGVSGLLSTQAAINTVSHNIANANNENYNRQVTQIDTRNPQFTGGNYIGTGSELDAITRIFDASTLRELQSNISIFNQLDVYLDQASRIDNLIADASTGLNGALQNFFSAVQTVANDPSSIAARQVLLSQGELLTSRFQTLTEQLNAQTRAINVGITAAADEITVLGQSIADMNVKIAASTGGGLGSPNDLLDQRDALINDLSKLVNINVIYDSNENANVFIGSGQALVVGATANRLVALPKVDDPKNLDLNLQTGSASIGITSLLNGGKLGGFLSFRNDILENSYNVMGRVALAVSSEINTQNQLGMDFNDQLGGLFFRDVNDPGVMSRRVISSTSNTGNASISLQIDDVNLVNDANYELRFQGGNYILTNNKTNAVVASFPPPGALPATISVASEGFSVVVNSGAALNGDRFSVFPTRDGGAEIKMLLTDPTQIAAAKPVNATSSLNNIGTGSIAEIIVTDTSTPQFTNIPGDIDPPILFEFLSPTTFNVRDANTNAIIVGGVGGFIPGQQNNLLALAGLNYGYDVSVTGQPQTGDTFNVFYNTGGVGDNGNMLLMGELQQQSTLDNGTSNFQQAFGRLVSDVGTRTKEARINLAASETLVAQVRDRRESISGVNLDEEAAKLIKFEQAYQASAQVISVARSLFQTIIDSTR